MGKLIYDISMSLDGFIAGANVRPEAGWAGLGDGGERLHDWGFNSADPRNREIAEAWWRTLVLLLLAEPRITFQYSIGGRTDQPALLVYQPSLFHIVCPKIYPMEVCIFSLTALKLRMKKRKKRQDIKIL